MKTIDKKFVRQSFNASAATYDRYAGLQQRMIDVPAAYVSEEVHYARRVLDVGVGTGMLTEKLRYLFPQSVVHGCDIADKMLQAARKRTCRFSPSPFFCTADAESLPYREGVFDLVVSSFTYQWLSGFCRAAAEAKRVLRPGGWFVFSVFGKGTFKELRAAYREACLRTGYHGGEALELVMTEKHMCEALLAAELHLSDIRSFPVVEKYPSMRELVRSIKGMGARNASPQRNRALGVRKIWKEMTAFYEDRFRNGAGVYATFEIIAGKARKQ